MKPLVAAAVILVALAAGGLAHALKVEALAALGELLKQTPKAKGGQSYQQGQNSNQEKCHPPHSSYLFLTKGTE